MFDEAEEMMVAAERMSSADRERIIKHLDALQDKGFRIEEPPRTHAVMAGHEFISVEEYLAFEEDSRVKHEYVAGRVYAMTGTTRAHNHIILNLAASIKSHLRGGPCSVYAAELRTYIKVDREEFFYYPDVVVSCDDKSGEPKRIDDAKLVIEVLSPSTEAVDRREKRLNYRNIPTLEEYVLISQRSPEITFHRRSSGWHPHACTALQGVAEFRSIQLAVPLRQIYEKVF
jgi:Uma2 family endonuclease